VLQLLAERTGWLAGLRDPVMIGLSWLGNSSLPPHQLRVG